MQLTLFLSIIFATSAAETVESRVTSFLLIMSRAMLIQVILNFGINHPSKIIISDNEGKIMFDN